MGSPSAFRSSRLEEKPEEGSASFVPAEVVRNSFETAAAKRLERSSTDGARPPAWGKVEGGSTVTEQA